MLLPPYSIARPRLVSFRATRAHFQGRALPFAWSGLTPLVRFSRTSLAPVAVIAILARPAPASDSVSRPRRTRAATPAVPLTLPRFYAQEAAQPRVPVASRQRSCRHIPWLFRLPRRVQHFYRMDFNAAWLLRCTERGADGATPLGMAHASPRYLRRVTAVTSLRLSLTAGPTHLGGRCRPAHVAQEIAEAWRLRCAEIRYALATRRPMLGRSAPRSSADVLCTLTLALGGSIC